MCKNKMGRSFYPILAFLFVFLPTENETSQITNLKSTFDSSTHSADI